jgi:hypothetical protein
MASVDLDGSAARHPVWLWLHRTWQRESARTGTWRRAAAGRLALLGHWRAGHGVSWHAASTTTPPCAGDVVCHDCGQILWCRSSDPWRRAQVHDQHAHGCGTARPAVWTSFERLEDILRLADACRYGPAGDEIRRAACELIEADSEHRRLACRQRILTRIARVRVDVRHRRTAADEHQLGPLNALAEALGDVRLGSSISGETP